MTPEELMRYCREPNAVRWGVLLLRSLASHSRSAAKDWAQEVFLYVLYHPKLDSELRARELYEATVASGLKLSSPEELQELWWKHESNLAETSVLRLWAALSFDPSFDELGTALWMIHERLATDPSCRDGAILLYRHYLAHHVSPAS